MCALVEWIVGRKPIGLTPGVLTALQAGRARNWLQLCPGSAEFDKTNCFETTHSFLCLQAERKKGEKERKGYDGEGGIGV